VLPRLTEPLMRLRSQPQSRVVGSGASASLQKVALFPRILCSHPHLVPVSHYMYRDTPVDPECTQMSVLVARRAPRPLHAVSLSPHSACVRGMQLRDAATAGTESDLR
jgi:hypothetical protein